MKNALEFARKYAGWHSFDKRDRTTRTAIQKLAKMGLVEITGPEFGSTQFRSTRRGKRVKRVGETI